MPPADNGETLAYQVFMATVLAALIALALSSPLLTQNLESLAEWVHVLSR